jgi:hypothetical protein
MESAVTWGSARIRKLAFHMREALLLLPALSRPKAQTR